jgi:hypothetical protein
MFISSLETVWTFSIAYPTAVVLGKVLLQTAPERMSTSTGGGPTEAFLRVMRDVGSRSPIGLPLSLKLFGFVELD